MQSKGEFRRQSPFKEVFFLGGKMEDFDKYKAFLNWERKYSVVKTPVPGTGSLSESFQKTTQN